MLEGPGIRIPQLFLRKTLSMIRSQLLSKKISGRLSWIITLLVPVVGLVAILDIPFYFTRTSTFIQQYLALFWGLISALIF
jgi:hypothetical protein